METLVYEFTDFELYSYGTNSIELLSFFDTFPKIFATGILPILNFSFFIIIKSIS